MTQRHLVLYVAVIAVYALLVQSAPVERTFLQRRDHFNPQDTSTFIQHYWINEEFYKSGGPTLVYLTNFPSPTADLQSSAISSWGQDIGAVLVELEVRYSGQSDPTANFTSTTFRFQSPEQNLADLTAFHTTFVKSYPTYVDSDWILIGEYYNANFAIWAREKNPNVFRGAVAVAGPVLAVAEYPTYFEYWATIAGEECSTAIHNANDETEYALAQDPQQADQLKALFGCTDVEDNTQFFYVLGQLIQFGIAYERDLVCTSLQGYSTPSELVQQYSSLISQLLQLSGVTDCDEWNIASNTNPDDSYRPTFYLDCAYFGQFETAGTDTPTTIVSHKVNYLWYLSVCEELFGTVLIPNVDQTNTVYGGLEPWGTNYAFVTSTSDPFRALVINETSLPNSEIIRIPTVTSIFSFLAGDRDIPYNVQQARSQVLALIETWIDIPSTAATVSPSLSPAPVATPTATSTGSNAGSLNWTLYLYMVVGVICCLLLSGVMVVFILQFTKQKLNAQRGR